MQATGSCGLIPPFGGRLVDLVCHDEDERRSLLERAERLPKVPLSLRAQYDLEMLAVGAFSPLDRFMGRWDYASVLSDMRLTDGTVFPIPLAVPVRMPALRDWLRDVALTDEAGTVLAVMEVEQIYPFDSLREMRAVLGATDTAHPLVAESADWPVHYLSGHPRVLGLPRHRLHGPLCLTPAETRARLAALGHSQVVAFQTRNPMHRIHEELTKRAAHAVGGALLLHPAVGVTRPQDVDPALRVEAYEVLVRNYYDPATTLLSLMPLAMRFAGPREAVWHSIIRRNYGATHLIIGRDHAGPGKDSQGARSTGPTRRRPWRSATPPRSASSRSPSRSSSTWPTRIATRRPAWSRPEPASSRSPAPRCATTIWPRASGCPPGSPARKWRRSCRRGKRMATAPRPDFGLDGVARRAPRPR